MIKIIKYSFLFIISFLCSYELLSSFSVNSNTLIVEEKEPIDFSKSNQEAVYLIGDSFAKTGYVDNGFPKIYQKHFNAKGINFVDLTKNSSELVTHKKLLDSLNLLKPKLIIYYFNIGDVLGWEESKLTSYNSEENNKVLAASKPSIKNEPSFFKQLSNKARLSQSAVLLRDAIQYSYVSLTDQAKPGSYTYKFPTLVKKHQNDIQTIFNSIQSERVIILVTSPFNYGKKPKGWDHYSVFENMELNNNITLVQAVDLVNDPELAVSWRNGHPNQEAIGIIADHILQLYQRDNNK